MSLNIYIKIAGEPDASYELKATLPDTDTSYLLADLAADTTYTVGIQREQGGEVSELITANATTLSQPIQILANRAVTFPDEALVIPTYDGDPNVAHPSVIYFEDGWNGYKYWMAMTPYPFESRENPSILTSNDGVNWLPPVGLTNPIEPEPSGGYNSDTELVYVQSENKMYLIWRSVIVGNTFFYRTSVDGINWVDKTEFVATTTSVSPTLVYRNGIWNMWYVFNEEIPFKMYRKTASTLLGLNTATPVLCDLGIVPTDYSPWHISVDFDIENNQYVAILNFTKPVVGGAPNNGGRLAFATSLDGINFDVNYNWFNFDGEMYRSDVVKSPYSVENGALYELFYNPKWRINRSLIWIKPTDQPAQDYDSVASKIAGVFGFKYRLANWVDLPVARIRKISTNEIRDVFPSGESDLMLANGTLIDVWANIGDLELLRLYNQKSDKSDFVSWSGVKPKLTKSPWNGTEKWGWNNVASDQTYGMSYTGTVLTPIQGVTVSVNLVSGKIVSLALGATYFGIAGTRLYLLNGPSHNVARPTEPAVLTGVWGSGSVIRSNGNTLSTGNTNTVPENVSLKIIVGGYTTSGAEIDFLEGEMTELVTWSVQPTILELEVVENQMMLDYPYEEPIDPSNPPLSSYDGNLQAYYKLNDTTGSVIDEQGNYPATITGSITRGVAGKYGNAFKFNGDAFVSTGITSLGNEFTIAQWINTADTAPWETLWSKSIGLQVYIYVGKIRVFVNGVKNIEYSFSSTNTWVHVALTVKENGFVRLYVNGINVAEYSITTLTSYPEALIIGREGIRYYNNLMDDVRIYNAELKSVAMLELAQL